MVSQYTFKIYSRFEALLFIVIVLAISVIIIGYIGAFLHPYLPEIGKSSIQLILLLIVGKAFFMAKNILTITVTVHINDTGLLFVFQQSTIGIKKKDVSITWQELEGWHLSEETTSSPPHFILKYLQTQRLLFYYPKDKDNQPLIERFYRAFTQKIRALNTKAKWVSPILELNYYQMYRTSYIVFSVLMLLGIIFFLFFFATKKDYLFTFTGVIIILFLGFWGVICIDLLKKLLKK